MTVATVDHYVEAYFSGLKTNLDAIDSALYADLVANAAVNILNYNTGHLTTAQLNQAQALLVCIDAAEMPSVAGFSQEKFFDSLKIYDRTMKKVSGLDWATGAFCRLLNITLKEFNSKSATSRAANYTKTRTNLIYLPGTDLDQRARVFKDFDLEDVRSDREINPRISSYGTLGRSRVSSTNDGF